MFAADKGRLVFGKYLGVKLVHSQTRRHRSGRPVTVSRHHDDTCKALAVEHVDDPECLLADGILDTDHCGKFSAQSQIEQGAVIRQIVEFLPLVFTFGQPAFFVFKNKMIASDQGAYAVDGTGNSVGNNIFHFGMALFMDDLSLLRFPDHRIRDGMGKMLLQAGCKSQHLLLFPAAEGDHPADTGSRIGQSPCLVEHNGIGLGDGLQELASLDIDVMIAALTHGREHRNRHGQLQGTGKIDHQEGKGPCRIAGQKPGESSSSQ